MLYHYRQKLTFEEGNMIFHQVPNSYGNYNYNARIYQKPRWVAHFHGNYELIYAMEGETYRSIAEANNLFLRELLGFNDLKNDAHLTPGTIVYLQKKKKQAVKGVDMHVVEAGETLRGIAQRYGVSMKSICRMNGLMTDGLIREGDIVRLRK